MNPRTLMVLIAATIIAADNPKDDAVKKDLDKLKGTWLATSYVKDAKPAPEPDLKMMKLVIAGDQVTFTKGKDLRKATYKLDPTQKPKAVDIVMVDGPDKGKTLQGIYEIRVDELKTCLAILDKPRPKEVSANTVLIMQTWKR